ncbi:MAG: hypothetical protein WC548_02005 [Candidatus Pacearchaeota archaeon]
MNSPNPLPYVHVKIQKVLELEGAIRKDFNCRTSVCAHVSTPCEKEGRDVQYVMMDLFPRNGIMYLGNINPETKIFECFDMSKIALYERANNHVVKKVMVPISQFSKLKTLEEVLSIEGISVKRELIPSD